MLQIIIANIHSRSQKKMSFFYQCLILISFTISLVYFFTRKKTNLPPGPTPIPVIGNLLSLGNSPHRSLASLAKTYGPVMTLKLGQVTTIVVSSPSLAREVLLTNDKSFCGRSVNDALHVHDHHVASMVWSPTNQLWKSLRNICATQLMSSQRLDATRWIREEKVRAMVGYLRSKQGEAVDIGEVVFVTVLNSISNALFSKDMVQSFVESSQGFRELMRGIMVEVGSPNLSDYFPAIRGLDLQGIRRRSEKYFGRFHEIFDELIDERMEKRKLGDCDASMGMGKDFLDKLVGVLVDGDVAEFDRVVLRCLLLDVFVAGVDTSSSTIEWAMAELLHNPTAMSKARAELSSAFPNETSMDEPTILQLPYLQAIIKETLRLHPAIPFLVPRSTVTSASLSGYEIPAGMPVLVNSWAIGRDETVWGEDASEFHPERFMGKEVDYRGRDMELIPFGAGRRMCPGLPLASRMMSVVLAGMLRSFNWALAEGMEARDVDLSDKFGVTLAMAVPVQAVPVPDSC